MIMNQARFEERRQELQNALRQLAESAKLPETDIVRDSTIQRFEFTFELAWKALQLYLENQGLESGSPRQAVKNAFQLGILRDERESDLWFKMLDDRNLTSHTYKEELAEAIYGRIISIHYPLLQTLSERLQVLQWK